MHVLFCFVFFSFLYSASQMAIEDGPGTCGWWFQTIRPHNNGFDPAHSDLSAPILLPVSPPNPSWKRGTVPGSGTSVVQHRSSSSFQPGNKLHQTGRGSNILPFKLGAES